MIAGVHCAAVGRTNSSEKVPTAVLDWRLSRAEVWLLVAILVTRLAYVLVAGQIDPFLKKDPLYGDAKPFDHAAWSLVTGKGFDLEVHRAPLHGLMMAGVYAVVGHQPDAVRVLQALMTPFAALFYLVGFRALFGSRVGLCFLVLMLLQPQLLHVTGWLYSENLVLLLVGALFVAHLAALRTDWEVRAAVIVGVLFGLLSLTRPTFLPMLALYVLWMLFRLPRGRRLAVLGAVVLPALVVISPWTYRNYNVHGAFVPISMAGGVFAGFNSPESYGKMPPTFHLWPMKDGTVVDVWAETKGKSLYEIDKFYGRTALRWVMENPGHTLAQIPNKYYNTLSPLGTGVPTSQRPWQASSKLQKLADAVFFAYLAVCVWGLGRALRRYWAELIPFTLMALTIFLAVTVFGGTSRYLLPLAPVFLAGFCVVLCRWRSAESSRG
jgi:4-amino-4-deoxy-L-arabinose transferase-like glycosyltransferase